MSEKPTAARLKDLQGKLSALAEKLKHVTELHAEDQKRLRDTMPLVLEHPKLKWQLAVIRHLVNGNTVQGIAELLENS